MWGNSSHQWELSCLSVEVAVTCVLSISAAERGKGGKPVQIIGVRGPTMLHLFLSFSLVLDVIRWWFYHVNGSCGQRPSCVWRCLLYSLTFSFTGPPVLWGPKFFLFFRRCSNPLSAAQLCMYVCMMDQGKVFCEPVAWGVLVDEAAIRVSPLCAQASDRWWHRLPISYHRIGATTRTAVWGNWTNCILGAEP